MSLPLFSTLREMGLPMPQGVLQVGASYGQEMREFLENGIKAGVFIEPLREPFEHLSSICMQLPNFVAVNTLCTDESGKEYTFHLASNGGQSSSILKPARHLEEFDYVKFESTTQLISNTLDNVTEFLRNNGHAPVVGALDLLYMDTQGAELKILMGANRTLKDIKYIFTEVMRGDLYEGQAPFLQFCGYLDAIGFTLNNMYFNRNHAGDALFIRKDVVGVRH
ncbi:MAG TPA: FkbM family methyltransferase [Rhizobacter sp.]|nr:FkbM family methyltransferase [Rhizobacter sp.]